MTLDLVPYAVWIWASPFQMARSRLPRFDDTTRTCRLPFSEVADIRGLEPFVLPTRSTRVMPDDPGEAPVDPCLRTQPGI